MVLKPVVVDKKIAAALAVSNAFGTLRITGKTMAKKKQKPILLKFAVAVSEDCTISIVDNNNDLHDKKFRPEVQLDFSDLAGAVSVYTFEVELPIPDVTKPLKVKKPKLVKVIEAKTEELPDDHES